MDRPARARILLVDDTELSRDLVEAVLVRAGFDVDVAADGETAWEKTWSSRFDLVLMDLEMPGMSGYETAARIRAREGVMSGVSIAALTASHEADAEQLALWSGIDTFIAKPVRPAHLIARIEAILDQRRDTGEDWRPVWRLHAFASASRQLNPSDCLDEFCVVMDEAAAAIHVHATDTSRFRRVSETLGDLAKRYGFDEIAGLCALYGSAPASGRSRDPNLLGAISRARYAVTAWRQRELPQPAPASRSWSGIRALFGGRKAA